ncbi:MAG TPA: DNA polymerase domain-containing protein, partial [Nitrososphaera sp.]|nr:DNA polymerase domain-containing protein [Nitrososphaera sp.]
QLTLSDASKAASLANVIEDIDAHDQFRLYNVDILPSQAYFYEHDLFPLAKCKVDARKDGKLEWLLNDNVRFTNYHLPEFKVISLDVTLKQEGRLPSFNNKIDTIAIKLENDDDNTTIEIRKQSEEDVLCELMRETASIDPDFIFTRDGDEGIFPYLTARAEKKNKMQLMLSREPVPILARPKEGGITYFSYGRVHYRASSVMLFGRVHIDTSNSLIHDSSSLHGLCEIARVCRMPLHSISRSTIGRALTSMQFYLAHKRKLLVPWKPANVEKVKTIKELVVADRGGLIMEPRVGVHERVAEFDFVSLYPLIISKLNVGADTINCDCCPDSKNIVPELGYHICEKRRGLVAESLEVPLQNRREYKHFRKLATDDKSWAIFDSRQGVLRTIGHVSFGYQGHAHSHFGLIDGHIAICAWARFIANKARKTAEGLDYDILHLIIDSLFVKKKRHATYPQYMKLKDEIERITNFDISFEGEYKWIAFLSSKSNPMVGVPNRYFGCYQDGTIKDRGIETRRHDTPAYFSRFQREILEIMAQGNDIKEVKALMPKVKETFQKYKQQLKEGRVPLVDLVFTKMLYKDTNAYTASTAETGAIYQLQEEGKSMRAGQILQYVITDYNRKNSRKRAIPVALINEKTTYDSRRYTQLLATVCNSVTEPFGSFIEL